MLKVDRTLVMTRAQCARYVSVTREAVRKRIMQGDLETIDNDGQEYIVARSAAKWRKERQRQVRAQLAKLGGAQ